MSSSPFITIDRLLLDKRDMLIAAQTKRIKAQAKKIKKLQKFEFVLKQFFNKSELRHLK